MRAHTGLTPTSEDEILTCIARHFPNKNPSILMGRGDDCALFHVKHSTAVSSDFFIENVHFRRNYFTPEEVGYKALAVNLSDLAACGAKPLAFTLNLGLPSDIEMNWLENFFMGMAEYANKCNITLIGGDLSKANCVQISITVFGEISGVSCFLARGGSMPGDALFLVGQIGLARIGLDVLERFGRDAIKTWPEACKAHLHPEPHLAAGIVLGRVGYSARPPALMDVSDGLTRDLPRLLGLSGEPSSTENEIASLGANITIRKENLHAEILRWSQEEHVNPIYTALWGGEDYALLGACAPDLLPSLEAAIPEFIRLGTITNDGKIVCNGLEITETEGFDHFAGKMHTEE